MHPLILGRDWPGFNKLVGQYVGVHPQPDMSAVLSGNARLSDAADGEEELVGQQAPEVPLLHSTEDFQTLSC